MGEQPDASGPSSLGDPGSVIGEETEARGGPRRSGATWIAPVIICLVIATAAGLLVLRGHHQKPPIPETAAVTMPAPAAAPPAPAPAPIVTPLPSPKPAPIPKPAPHASPQRIPHPARPAHPIVHPEARPAGLPRLPGPPPSDG